MLDKFLLVQVYLPASSRVTWRTCHLPPWPNWERLLRKIFFPLTTWCRCRITTHRTLKHSTLIFLWPFGVYLSTRWPLIPGTPLIPGSLIGSGGPALPCFPHGPGSTATKRDIFFPTSPRVPLLPWDTLGFLHSQQSLHAISSFVEQNDSGDSEFKVLFISLLIVTMVIWLGLDLDSA